jgi:hypothetical protein
MGIENKYHSNPTDKEHLFLNKLKKKSVTVFPTKRCCLSVPAIERRVR